MSRSINSGAIIQSVDNPQLLAEKLSKKITNSRGCAIAIANRSNFILTDPRRYIIKGGFDSMPLEIKPGQTGLVVAHNNFGLTGSCGLLTYKLRQNSNISLKQIQILWSVPLNRFARGCKVNVRVGCESASMDVCEEMLKTKNGYGCLMDASETNVKPGIIRNGVCVRILMEDQAKAPLTIYVTNHKE